MSILQIVIFGIVTVILLVTVREQRPVYGVLIALAAGIIIFIAALGQIHSVLEVFTTLLLKANLDDIYLTTILKIIGVSYLSEFGAGIARDAGSETIANKLEFAGKVLMMTLSVPIIKGFMDLIFKILMI